MRKFIVLSMTILFSACNSNILIKSKNLSYAKMIKNIDGGKVCIELKSGKTLKGKITKFTLDTISIKNENIPVNIVSKITHTKNVKDPLKALLFCSLILSADLISAELAYDSLVVKQFLIFLGTFGFFSDFTNKKNEYIFQLEDPSYSKIISK